MNQFCPANSNCLRVCGLTEICVVMSRCGALTAVFSLATWKVWSSRVKSRGRKVYFSVEKYVISSTCVSALLRLFAQGQGLTCYP